LHHHRAKKIPRPMHTILDKPRACSYLDCRGR
jgi:hypothetical protein